MPIESIYGDGRLNIRSLEGIRRALGFQDMRELPQGTLSAYPNTMDALRGADALTLPAFTNQKESGYGARINTKQYSIVLEGDTEDSVYLKIIKKQ